MNFPPTKSAAAVLVAGSAMIAAMSMTATAAHAATDDSARSRIVHFADLNPNSVAGSKTLYRRLTQAAEQVCGDDLSVVDLDQMRNIEKCKQIAIENAVAEIHQPRLIDLYDRSFPREPLVYVYPLEKLSLTQSDGSVLEVIVLAVHG